MGMEKPARTSMPAASPAWASCALIESAVNRLLSKGAPELLPNSSVHEYSGQRSCEQEGSQTHDGANPE